MHLLRFLYYKVIHSSKTASLLFLDIEGSSTKLSLRYSHCNCLFIWYIPKYIFFKGWYEELCSLFKPARHPSSAGHCQGAAGAEGFWKATSHSPSHGPSQSWVLLVEHSICPTSRSHTSLSRLPLHISQGLILSMLECQNTDSAGTWPWFGNTE